jgi:hypothetical protein
MEVENIILNQTQHKYYMISHMWKLKNKNKKSNQEKMELKKDIFQVQYRLERKYVNNIEPYLFIFDSMSKMCKC